MSKNISNSQRCFKNTPHNFLFTLTSLCKLKELLQSQHMLIQQNWYLHCTFERMPESPCILPITDTCVCNIVTLKTDTDSVNHEWDVDIMESVHIAKYQILGLTCICTSLKPLITHQKALRSLYYH